MADQLQIRNHILLQDVKRRSGFTATDGRVAGVGSADDTSMMHDGVTDLIQLMQVLVVIDR